MEERNYTIRCVNRGHWLLYDEITKEWYFESTGEKYSDELDMNLICPKCNMKPHSNGHDACMVNVPNVEYACCGHGIENQAYLKYNDGTTKYFKTTEEILNYIKQ